MAISARTAPKSKGSDVIEIKILGPGDLEPLAAEMESLAASAGMKFFLRDAGNCRQSGACLLIGADGLATLGLNCGACGHATYRRNEIRSPDCSRRHPFTTARSVPSAPPISALRSGLR